MGSDTLITIISDVCSRIGLTAPTSVVGNSDPQIKQMLAIANESGISIAESANKNGGWQELRKQHTFSTEGVSGITGDIVNESSIITNISDLTDVSVGMLVMSNYIPSETYVVSIDSATQITVSNPATANSTDVDLSFGKESYDLPSDFKYFINQTYWDRSFRWQLLGPLSAQEWQILQSGFVAAGPRTRFRIFNNLFYLNPAPTSVHTLVYEYYSNAWCQSSLGVNQKRWTADTDIFLLEDEVLKLDIKWRFLRAKGFDYLEEKIEATNALNTDLARNGGSRTLPLSYSGYGRLRLLSEDNIPDTNFGS